MPKFTKRAFVVAIAAAAAGCSQAGVLTTGSGFAPAANVSFHIADADGETVGIALATEVPGGVFLEAEFTGLAAGTHGFHIHETGVCVPPFTSAGGHFNPEGKEHGRDNPKGHHIGDLMNIHVPDSGILSVSAVAEGATLASGGRNSLADENGSALVVHRDADDNISDPTGNAGPRIACGVIFGPRAAS